MAVNSYDESGVCTMSTRDNFETSTKGDSISHDSAELARVELFGAPGQALETSMSALRAMGGSSIDWLPSVSLLPSLHEQAPSSIAEPDVLTPKVSTPRRLVPTYDPDKAQQRLRPEADAAVSDANSGAAATPQLREQDARQTLRHLESREFLYSDRSRYNHEFDWRMEQSEINGTARIVAQTLRNTNGMLQPGQEAILRATLESRLVGSTSDGSHGQGMLRQITDATNRRLHGSGYMMIYDPGITGAPMIRFDRHFEGSNEGRRYPAFQPFMQINLPGR